jgi:nitroreductase/NAD-dependent dihydropyrimidine dehydrogenase PreA subunit
MALFSVDHEKCTGDGICASVCPVGIIKMPELNGGHPEPVTGAELMCINCGHCLAVCPQGALTLESMKDSEMPVFDHGLLPSPEQLTLAMCARRSVRVYQEKRVPRETLASLIDVARYAPSGGNSQPVHWLIIENPDEVQRLAGLVIDWMRLLVKENPQDVRMGLDRLVAAWDLKKDAICRNAPHLIIAHGPQSSPMTQSSCIIALTYLELAAFVYGLGACWAGFVHWAATAYPPLQQALALPDDHPCCGGMLIGYPEYRYHRIPARKEAPLTWR